MTGRGFLLLLVVLLHNDAVRGQGLLSGDAMLGASMSKSGPLAKVYITAEQQWSSAKAWRRALKASPAKACVSTSRSSLCSADASSDAAAAATLMFATSPAAYSSLNTAVRVISTPRNQLQCSSCTAFAAVTAAEAAAARGLDTDVRDVGRLSPQDLYYCGSEMRTCGSGASIKTSLDEIKKRQLISEDCMPYSPPPFMGIKTQDQLCERACSDTNQILAQGRFNYVPIDDMAVAQEHIREWGAVVTRFNIMSDFKPFFKKYENTRAVYKDTPGSQLVEQHAVVLIGYDNDGQYWIVRNSWGADFADDGNFRVAFGVAGVLNPGDTFGVIFMPGPKQRRRPPLKLEPAFNLPSGCSYYTAVKGDYLSGIAYRAGVSIQKLLLDNLETIKDLDAPLAGKRLVVCTGTASPTGKAPLPAPSKPPLPSQPPPSAGGAQLSTQLEALIGIRLLVDKFGALAKVWTLDRGAGGAYCTNFVGVSCDGAKNVIAVTLNDGTVINGNKQIMLGGSLPTGVLLKGLPKLTSITLANVGLSGMLSPDWGVLTQLETIDLRGNSLSGPLPNEWSRLSRIKSLYLSENQLTGTLSPELGAAWPAIQEVMLRFNALNGPLPNEWAKMRQLRILAVSANKLTGTLHPGFGSAWPAMEDLQLHSNSFTGPLPREWAKMNRLRVLWIHANRLTGTLHPELGSAWPAMEDFSLSENAFYGTLPKEWAKMTRMKGIWFFGNKLTGTLPPELSAWKDTTDLQLQNNIFSGPLPRDWSKLTQLQILNVAENKLTGTLSPEFSAWKDVSDLQMRANAFTGPLPKEWTKLGKLKTLTLSSNLLTGSLHPGFGSAWPAMADLELHNNSFTGPLPKEWAKMTKLKILWIHANRLTGTLHSELGSAWPAMEDFGLSENAFYGTLPKEWAKMTRMKAIWFFGNKLTGTLPPEFSAWKDTTDLQLHNNTFTGRLPKDWSKLTRLQILNLSYNKLTGPLPSEWSKFTAMKQLSLRENRLTGSLPPSWGTLTAATEILIDNNRLVGPVPPSWTTLRALDYLWLAGNSGLKGCLPRGLDKFKGNQDTCADTAMTCTVC